MSVVVNQPYSTAGNGGRKLVRLENGVLMCVLLKDGYYSLRKSDNSGYNWTEVHNYGVNIKFVSLTSHGNVAYLLFCYGTSIYIRTYNSDGSEKHTKMIEGSQTVNSVSLAIDPSNGHLHACWSSKNSSYPNSFNIRYSKSTDGGITWSAVEQLTKINNTGFDLTNPTITTNKNGYPVIISQYKVSNLYFIIAYYFDGNSWVYKEIYDGNSYTQSSPSAVVDKDGVIHVAWYGKDSSSTVDKIKTSYSSDGGITWSQVYVFGHRLGNKYPSITADKDNQKYVVTYDPDYGDIASFKYTNGIWVESARAWAGYSESNPSTLYDPMFSGRFGDMPSTIYQDTAVGTVKYTGTYLTNQAPTLTLTDSNANPITNSQTIKHTNKTPFLFSILGSDLDENDNLEYAVWLRNMQVAPWASLTNGEEIQYSFSHDSANERHIVEDWDANNYSTVGTTVNSISDSVLNVTSTTGDPMFNMYDIGSFDPNIYRYIEVKYRILNGVSTNMEFFFTNDYSAGATAEQHLGTGLLNSDGQWHTVRVDGWSHGNWKTKGNIKGWRFDYATTSGVNMEVDYLALVPDDTRLLIGSNPVEVKVRDGNGGEVSSSFILRNLTPESYSQQHVYDLIVGYM